jgi:imidazolonepropionase-like amidohydrolase
MRRALRIGLLFSIAGLAYVARPGRGEPPSADSSCIAHVAIVDTESGDVTPNRTVVLAGGRIAAVVDGDAAEAAHCGREIDGRGKYLIPGLWDLHVHGARREELYPIFLANGVTGVRDMFGPREPRALRRGIEERGLDAPRMVLSSPILDGEPPIWPGSIVVTTVEQARRVVAEQKELGSDFLKVYQRLSRDVYYAIVAEAHRLGIPVAGHVTSSLSPWEAVAAGQRTIEHLVQVPLACSREETRLRQVPVRSYAGALRLLVEASQSFDPARCALFYEAMKRNGTWAVPTLTTKRADGWPNDPQFAAAERLRYFGTEVRGFLAPGADGTGTGGLTDEDRRFARELFDFDRKIVGEMFRAGVGILAGTDCLNSYSFPGFGLHDELEYLVDAGLTPLAALQAATLRPAEFLARIDLYGTVTAGRMADLVLLDADPLRDIRNTRRVSAVVLGGKLFDRAALDRLLAEAERSAKTPDS